MTLNAKIGGFMDFLPILGCDTSLYYSQGGATELSLCAFRHDCNKCVVFYPKFPQIQLKQRQKFLLYDFVVLWVQYFII